MVTQRDLRRPQFPLRYDKGYRDEGENTVSKWFCPLESSLHDTVSILFNNLVLNAQLFKILGQNVFREARLLFDRG
ncbi:Uncharacterised protein [Escherichia coli]|nr:Uncharacterised protein [Escherichia coli]